VLHEYYTRNMRRGRRCRARIKVRGAIRRVPSYEIWRTDFVSVERCAAVGGDLLYSIRRPEGFESLDRAARNRHMRASFPGRDGRVGARVPARLKPAIGRSTSPLSCRIRLNAVSTDVRRSTLRQQRGRLQFSLVKARPCFAIELSPLSRCRRRLS